MKKGLKPQQSRVSARNRKGQAIAEGAAIMILLVSVSVGLLLLLLNTAVLGGYDYKLRIVAEQSAKSISKMKYWLGMERDDYNAKYSEAQAEVIANQALDNLGMPHILPGHLKVTYPEYHYKNTNGVNVNMHMVKVEMTVGGLKTIGGLFPPFVTLSAVGEAFEEGFPPYAMGIQTYRDPSTGTVKSIRFPIYSARKMPPNGTTYQANQSYVGYNKTGYANLGHVTGPFTTVFLPINQAADVGGCIYRVHDGNQVSELLPW